MHPGDIDPAQDRQGLFSPFPLGQAVLKNRVIALPVFTGYAHPDGRLSRLLTEHYVRLADSAVCRHR